MSKNSQRHALLPEIRAKLPEFTNRIVRKLHNPHLDLDIGLTEINGLMYKFLTTSKLNQDKVELNDILKDQMRIYLESPEVSKIDDLTKLREDPHSFIEIVSLFWDNFQRFIFTYKLITEKASVFFKTFHKLQDKIRSSKLQCQVQPVAVMGVNYLRDYMEQKNVFKFYATIFCEFIKKERNGIVVPREKIKESIQFFESTYFDFDAEAVRIGDRLFIRKRNNPQAQPHRHSTAQKFFERNIMGALLRDCQVFYTRFVEEKTFNMPATQEVAQMMKYLKEEEARVEYYIHEEENARGYLECVEKSLVILKMESRLSKQSGLKKYLRNFEYGKNQYREEIQMVWKVFGRVYDRSKTILIKLYGDYLMQEGKQVQDTHNKGPEFINNCIILNKKNIEIVQMLGGMLDFDRIRVQYIQKILSNELGKVEDKKNETRYYQGAKHVAGVFHQKIRAKYGKEQPFGPQQEDLLNIFKILKYKMMCLKEYTRHLSTRLLEDLDMTKDGVYSNAIALQTKIIEEMKKESSQNDVKNLQQCVKDITKSQQLFSNIKKKTEIGKKYHFLNQLIVKNNIFWYENPFFDAKPPKILQGCVFDTYKELEKSGNVQFQLSNGVTTFRGTFGKNKFNFNIKSLYALILFCIDERATKRMCYSELIDQLRPGGRQVERSYVQLQRFLVQLCVFGLLKTDKEMKPENKQTLAKMDSTNWFEINQNFTPQKKAPMYKSAMIAMVPPYIKEALQISSQSIGDSDKEIERSRRIICELHIVQTLKHAHTKNNTVTIEELQKDFDTDKKLKQWDINPRFMKETLEGLIHKFFCERVEGKKNTLRYIA